jgi:hypothetical protein
MLPTDIQLSFQDLTKFDEGEVRNFQNDNMGSILLLVLDVVDVGWEFLSFLLPLVLVSSGRCPTRWMSLICFDVRMVEIHYCT